MVQKAKVTETSDGLAVIEVSRKTMCDGCHKSECGNKCAMGAIFSGGSTMTATATNEIGAKPGDTVEIETSDREVLGIAAIVFLLPVILGSLLYMVGNYFEFSQTVSVILAVAGFISVFPIMKIIDSRKKKNGPHLFITRIINSDSGEKP